MVSIRSLGHTGELKRVMARVWSFSINLPCSSYPWPCSQPWHKHGRWWGEWCQTSSMSKIMGTWSLWKTFAFTVMDEQVKVFSTFCTIGALRTSPFSQPSFTSDLNGLVHEPLGSCVDGQLGLTGWQWAGLKYREWLVPLTTWSVSLNPLACWAFFLWIS